MDGESDGLISATARRGPNLRLPLLTLAFLAAGALVRFNVGAREATIVWMVGLVATGAPVVWRTLRSAVSGHFATDVVATLAVVTAVVLLQPIAGLVIVLMQTGGEALEQYAEGRASSAVRALEEEAPRIAHRITGSAPTLDAPVEDVGVAAVAVDDFLLVRPGEMVPVDGEVLEGNAHVDTSRLTGEPIPARASVETLLSSGSLVLDGPLVLRATATAGASQYARIVELVRSAQSSKAPLQRLADRYAIWFTPVTLVACVVAYLASGDMQRVLAVLVVATPCPLILATPIAIIGGVNRAARRLIVVRNGGALEQLAGVTTAVFDKTGTLTVGTPRVSDVIAAAGFEPDDVLALAASVERGSGHLLARSVVSAAESRGLALSPVTDMRESAGCGVTGLVDGQQVSVGARNFVAERAKLPSGTDASGLRAYVAVDGRFAGALEFADELRPELPELFHGLAHLGVRRLVLLSGDSKAHTQAVAAQVGLTDARGELLPADKVAVVAGLVGEGERVLMVGDGTNDAPALSTATVGVALAGHGGGITAEAADVVILNDDPSRVVEAIQISRRTLRIARQSIWAGLGLSGGAMVVAAMGYISPVFGAMLQEAIDVAVIVNALRTSVQPRRLRAARTSDASMAQRKASIGTEPTTARTPNIATADRDWRESA